MEIRDDCRNNPRCPKSALIEIAKKKTPEQMNALYAGYKKRGLTGLDTEKRVRLPKNAEKADTALARVEALEKALGQIRMEDLSEAKKSSLREALESLKKTIDDLLIIS